MYVEVIGNFPWNFIAHYIAQQLTEHFIVEGALWVNCWFKADFQIEPDWLWLYPGTIRPIL